jgi:hypothetical protein
MASAGAFSSKKPPAVASSWWFYFSRGIDDWVKINTAFMALISRRLLPQSQPQRYSAEERKRAHKNESVPPEFLRE